MNSISPFDTSQPRLQPLSSEININIANPDYNPTLYKDHILYNSIYNSECEIIAKFELLIKDGYSYIDYLYYYRSISKAIPDIVSYCFFHYTYFYYITHILPC